MSSLHLINSYVKFLWNSKNEYSVHSPFVFDLLTQCFYDRTNYPDYATMADFRKSLIEDKSEIEVADFGAGSRVFESDRRRVSDIAKNAGISPDRAMLLYRISRYFRPKTILEIGTSLGLATSAISIGNPNSKITTLEGCLQTSSVAKRQFDRFGLQNIDVKLDEFSSALDALAVQHLTFDLIYFDGNHQKEATLAYFETLLPTAKNDSVWIFDDIHWSADMEQAWKNVIQHPKVTVSIDTFKWGLVFFRSEQPKEHFVIRI